MTVVAIVVVAILIQLVLAGFLVRERGRRNVARSQSQAILRAIPDLMFLVDADARFLDYHGNSGDLFAPPSFFIGKRVPEVLPPHVADRLIELFVVARQTGEPQVLEYLLPIGGEERSYEARIVACGEKNTLSIVRDITNSRRAEQSLVEQAVQLQQSHEHARDLAGRLIASQEIERARIARDLHDDLGQKVALLAVLLDTMEKSRRPGEMLARSQELKTRIEEMAGDIHRLAYELHPSKLETLGLVAAIDSCCREVSERHGLSVSFRRENVPPGIDGDLSVCVYRVVQEALHNIVKHSGAAAAEVWLTSDNNEIELKIADRGKGFQSGSGSSGLGLVSMRERVQFFGGRFVVRSTPGTGTRIGVRIPLAVGKAAARTGQQIA